MFWHWNFSGNGTVLPDRLGFGEASLCRTILELLRDLALLIAMMQAPFLLTAGCNNACSDLSVQERK